MWRWEIIVQNKGPLPDVSSNSTFFIPSEIRQCFRKHQWVMVFLTKLSPVNTNLWWIFSEQRHKENISMPDNFAVSLVMCIQSIGNGFKSKLATKKNSIRLRNWGSIFYTSNLFVNGVQLLFGKIISSRIIASGLKLSSIRCNNRQWTAY
jgi:hypothetical protein